MPRPKKFRVVEILEGPHTMVAILYIGMNRGCLKSDLYHDVSHNSSMSRKLDELEKADVIRMVQEGRGTKLYLTDRGKEIAKHIDGINDAIKRAMARKKREKEEAEAAAKAAAEAAAAEGASIEASSGAVEKS